MKRNILLGLLLLAASLTLMTGCQKQETLSQNSSEPPESSVQGNGPQTTENQDVDLDQVKTFIEGAIPATYLTSPDYQLELEDQGDGSCHATLYLDMNADGSNFTLDEMDTIIEVTQFEAYYVAESCLGSSTVPLDLKLIFLLHGDPMATVEKMADSSTYTRTAPDGTTDTFES